MNAPGNLPCRGPPRPEHSLSTTVSTVRHVINQPSSFGPATDPVAMALVRVRVSYLLSQWVQAPITDWREADT